MFFFNLYYAKLINTIGIFFHVFIWLANMVRTPFLTDASCHSFVAMVSWNANSRQCTLKLHVSKNPTWFVNSSSQGFSDPRRSTRIWRLTFTVVIMGKRFVLLALVLEVVFMLGLVRQLEFSAQYHLDCIRVELVVPPRSYWSDGTRTRTFRSPSQWPQTRTKRRVNPQTKKANML